MNTRKIDPIERVAELAHLVPALRKTRRIDCDESDFAVGVCDARGRVIAGEVLRCYRQVSFFSRAIARHRYLPLILDDESRMQGCDVLFVLTRH